MTNNHSLIEKHKGEILRFIELALKEDIGGGDYTTLATVAKGSESTARLVSKDRGIWAGNQVVQLVVSHFFEDLQFLPKINDGAAIQPGDVVYELTGSTASILSSERLVLNMVQHLSGVATTTHRMASLIADLPTKLLDTRKTTPGLRVLEKWAVKTGGGENHRMGLYDMVMIKDNHIDQCGSITLAVKRVEDYLTKNNLDLKIEVETRSVQDVEEVMNLASVHWVMLDNYQPHEIKEALNLIAGTKKTEASGGINKDNIRQYAETGVDYLSSGSLTQRGGALDLSLKILR